MQCRWTGSLHLLSLLLVPDSRQSCVHLQRLHTEKLLWLSYPVPCQAFTVRQTFMGQQKQWGRFVDRFLCLCDKNTTKHMWIRARKSPISVSILNRSDKALCFCCRMCLTSDFCFSLSADMSMLRLCRSRRLLMTSPEKRSFSLHCLAHMWLLVSQQYSVVQYSEQQQY